MTGKRDLSVGDYFDARRELIFAGGENRICCFRIARVSFLPSRNWQQSKRC